MSEELLHYIWQYKVFDSLNLKTTDGETLAIVHSGVRNHDAGPDFTQAKIRIDGDLLAGNIELHVNSSDWKKHGHQDDQAYSNIILHVVYRHDEKDTLHPTLELKDRIDGQFFSRYRQLMNSALWIPCQHQIGQLDKLFITSGLHRVLIERLEEKTSGIFEKLAQNKNSWEETFYQTTARNFGLKVNVEPFEALARSLPLKIIAKHKNSLLQIEALLFGQAGMLDEDFRDDYPKSLKKEYQFLRQKYGLQPLPPSIWKFMRLRPAGFPTVRIAQFAALLHKSAHLFSRMVEAEGAKQILELFRVNPSEYWLGHYRFDAASGSRSKLPGSDFLNALIINAAVPVMFIYGKSKGDAALQDKALSLLDEIPAEKNNIISGWKNLGLSPRSAYDSQALIHLKNNYCSKKRCLNCFVGNKLLRSAAIAA